LLLSLFAMQQPAIPEVDRFNRGASPYPDPGQCPNAMTVDVEDYFQVSAFEAHVARTQWDSFESRVTRNTERLLEIFEEHQTTGTFFVLGWVAERYPALVRRIADAGHEIASHGYAHHLVYSQTPQEFRQDLARARRVIEDACGVRVVGYRAPSYSITRRSLWALDVLLEEGYEYDASIFPIYHDRYGIPDAPRHTYQVASERGTLWELPGSTTQLAGRNLPIAGGGYFRLLPYAWTHYGIRTVNNQERKPVIFYLHPWEIDPDQPRLQASALSRLRHYRNLAKTEPRLRRLLADFRFDTVKSLLQREAQSTPMRTSAAALNRAS
jgi:polysaccharide deacetylase family protein (PEP-CTERM system associated)